MRGKYLPATSYNYLFSICEQYGFHCEIEGLDTLFDNDIDYDEFKEWCDDFFKDAQKKPRYYQIDSAYKGLKYKRCMLQLATSAGKTFIAFMMFAWLLTHRNVKKIMITVVPSGRFVQNLNPYHALTAIFNPQLPTGSCLRGFCR